MDLKRIQEEHIVARYLADQLDAHEAAAFEAYYMHHPEGVREIERALRLKEGLAVLRDEKRLDAIVRSTRPRWALPAALAAALVLAVVGLWTWRGAAGPSPLGGTLTQLAPSAQPFSVAGTYLLARMRGANSPLDIPLPPAGSAIELRILPSDGATSPTYQLELSRIGAQGEETPIAQVSGLTPSPDGLVGAYLDSGRLQQGSYSVELRAESPPTGSVDRFVIQLR